MENVMFVAWLCYCLLITAGADILDAGNPEIENCNAGFIDIRENANNTIKCKGFNGSDIIGWAFKRNDKNMSNGVATCYPSSNCTVHQPDHFAVERSPSHSTLFYLQYDREVDKGATVTCASLDPSSNKSMTCSLNVINPTKLSSCAVEEDRDRGTVRGSCRFEHAYSDGRAFLCIWFRKTDGKPSTLLSGHITYDSGSHGSSGWCTFTNTDTDWDAGTYTYTIYFSPGPVQLTVDIVNLENDLPIGAIAGGIVAAVAVVIIVVVVVVVFVRRKRKQKPAGSAHGSGNGNATDNDDFEEHVTPMVFTSDGPDASQEIDENTYEKPARRPPNAEPEHVYNDSNTAATTSTTTTTPSESMETTPGDLHYTPSNKHRGQGKTLDNVHHNPVYVNENQSGEESSGVQQHPTYANDHPQTAQGDVYANRDSSPYYSEIRDTGIN